jgi:hypothetical protein
LFFLVRTSMPQPTPQYEHAVRVTVPPTMGPMVGGHCSAKFPSVLRHVKRSLTVGYEPM